MPGTVAKRSRGGSGPPDQDDAFIRALNRFLAWAEANTGTLILAGTVLALGVGAAFYWHSYRQNLEERASASFSTLQARLAQGAAAPAVTDSLQAFLQRFGGTEAAGEARLLLARQQLGLGWDSAAVATVREVVSGHAPDSPRGYAARSLLAEAQVASGDTAAAISTWDVLAGSARFPFQRREAAAEKASLLAHRGRLQEARAIYARLAEEASGTQAGNLYAVRLGEVEARLASGGEGEATAVRDTAPGG